MKIQKTREYGYNKAIDEFADKLLTCSNYIFDEDFGYVIPISDIEDIAEQLKGGSDKPQCREPIATYYDFYADKVYTCPRCNGLLDYKQEKCKCGLILKWD